MTFFYKNRVNLSSKFLYMSENWSDYVGYAASVFVILSFMLKDIKKNKNH